MSSTAKKHRRLPDFFIGLGILCFTAAGIILLLTFFPVITEEIKYTVNHQLQITNYELKPVDTNFGIVIPKIGANAKVIDNINPFNEREYQIALTKGVAHARNTSYPGRAGNTFIFAHSSANWYEANRYNSVFYLLTKLETGDQIFLYYQGKKYVYTVTDKRIVDATAVGYLQKGTGNSTVTLMTCWPPGTTLKRLIVSAKITPN